MECSDDAGIQALEIQNNHIMVKSRFGLQYIAPRTDIDRLELLESRRDISVTMQTGKIEKIHRRHRASVATQFQPRQQAALYRKVQQALLIEQVPDQTTVLQVVARQSKLVLHKHFADFQGSVVDLCDALAALQQALRNRFEGKALKLVIRTAHQLYAIKYNPARDQRVVTIIGALTGTPDDRLLITPES